MFKLLGQSVFLRQMQLKLSRSMQVRCLHIHEYQSMGLMQQYGVKTPRFTAASTPEEAEIAAGPRGALGSCQDVVVKAQVLTGGRGLGYFKENGFQGGVHICSSPEDVRRVAEKMLGSTLVTKQTGASGGRLCTKILLAERFYIRRERYIAILMDLGSGGPLLIGSSVGGTSIEDIAERYPESIVKLPLDPIKGLEPTDVEQFVQRLGFTGSQTEEAATSIEGLYRMFVEKDCLLVEVNPFAETHDGRILVCDAKVSFDDNAAFRQKNVFELKDESQEDPREVAASRFDLNYVGLDGSIGCMVNGAGLAMATMDILQLHGGKPANFLDVGGGADNKQVMEALRILQNDTNVKAIFINIFGGIMRCDTIAKGLVDASSQLNLTKPMVVRLEGTRKEEAKQLLAESGKLSIKWLMLVLARFCT